jgi:hypothetical protein
MTSIVNDLDDQALRTCCVSTGWRGGCTLLQWFSSMPSQYLARCWPLWIYGPRIGGLSDLWCVGVPCDVRREDSVSRMFGWYTLYRRQCLRLDVEFWWDIHNGRMPSPEVVFSFSVSAAVFRLPKGMIAWFTGSQAIISPSRMTLRFVN